MPKKKENRPRHAFRRFCYDVINHSFFKFMVTVVIVIQCGKALTQYFIILTVICKSSAVVLSALTFGQSTQVSDVLDTSNMIIAILFAVEFGIKFTGAALFPLVAFITLM